MNTDIYGDYEIIPDRINTEDTSTQVSYPEQLIITFESIDKPSIANVTTTIRSHILESKKQGVQPDIILNFCIGYYEKINSIEGSQSYIQNYITLAEYITDIQKMDNSIKITISVRGLFLKCMIPLLYINVPVKVSKFTHFENYDGTKISEYNGVIESFIQSNNKEIQLPFKFDDKEINKLIQQKTLIK